MLFEANPNTGDVYKVKDANSVKQSVKNIVLTNFHERPFNPFLGGNVRALLFENITPFSITEAKNTLVEAITRSEPRAAVTSINISENAANSLVVNIVFRVKETQQVEEINISLERLR
jgi:phage baseplate assembly protein W